MSKFEKAKPEDLETIASIEKEFFGDYEKAFDLEFFKKWYDYNPNIFYVVRDDTGEVKAFTIMVPVTKETYDRISQGEIDDMYDFELSDTVKEVEWPYYYFADIAISKKNKPVDYMISARHLFKGIVDFLKENSKYILTTPVTTSGKKMCEVMGFKKIAKYGDGDYSIYRLEVNDKSIKNTERFR